MTQISIGDLSSHWSTRLQLTQVREEVNTLSAELATGRRSNILAEQKGDLSLIAALDRSIDINNRYRAANADTQIWLDAAQTSLESIQASASLSASQLMSAASTGSLPALQNASIYAQNELSAVISALNTTVGGSALFAGVETSKRPLVDHETLLQELSTVIAAATSTEDALAAIDTWFDDPMGGFSTVAYRGHASQSVQLVSSEQTALPFDVRANNPVLVNTLKALASAALARDPVFAGDAAAQTTMIQSSAERLLAEDANIAQVRGGVGLLQSHVEKDKVMLAATKAGFEIAFNDAYMADPYETASKLEAVTLQLETIYAITARVSDLTLARYL
ncbi:MAG: hypothetical protein QNJ03_07540 [Dinoroseobacter sp.]|nr:hypothetical protein [Dinoroseobacter sp.]